MLFTALVDRADETLGKLVDAELQMGLDSRLLIPLTSRHEQVEHPDLWGLPVRCDPRVTVRQWREYVHGNEDILHKEYLTPAGVLNTSVRLTRDWPHGERIPLMSDFLVPRSTKRLVTGPEDLQALQFLLTEPAEPDIVHFQRDHFDAVAVQHDVRGHLVVRSVGRAEHEANAALLHHVGSVTAILRLEAAVRRGLESPLFPVKRGLPGVADPELDVIDGVDLQEVALLIDGPIVGNRRGLE